MLKGAKESEGQEREREIRRRKVSSNEHALRGSYPTGEIYFRNRRRRERRGRGEITVIEDNSRLLSFLSLLLLPVLLVLLPTISTSSVFLSYLPHSDYTKQPPHSRSRTSPLPHIIESKPLLKNGWNPARPLRTRRPHFCANCTLPHSDQPPNLSAR